MANSSMLVSKDGYRGIWHGQPGGVPYKYSGGLGTYPQQLNPLAVYDRVSHRTYFVFGARARDPQPGRDIADGNSLQIHIGYFDHATRMVGRPRVVMSKAQAGTNPHENATLGMDDDGCLYVFVNTHGPSLNGDGTPYRGDSFIFKSDRPRDMTSFRAIVNAQRVLHPTDTVRPADQPGDVTRGTNFSYSQPWFVPGQGLLFLHTRYRKDWAGREPVWMTSTDGGQTWSDRALLAGIGQGHYQVSTLHRQTVATAFNVHPDKPNFEGHKGLDARTNLYFLHTEDLGRTWRTADGSVFTPGATTMTQLAPALVHDYAAEDRLVFLKDIAFDAQGRPVVLYLTSPTAHTGTDPDGPGPSERRWHTVRWDGSAWAIRDLTTSDHNYDFGSLYIEADGTWRVIAPTSPGPLPGGTGGTMAMWISEDQGQQWNLLRELAPGVGLSHAYARRPLHAHDDFYAFWADGNPFEVSESHLYFTNRDGTAVWQMPYRGITQELTAPELVWSIPEPSALAVANVSNVLLSRRRSQFAVGL